MAFQTSTGLQNFISPSIELLPSISTTLSLPFRLLRRTTERKPEHNAKSTTSTIETQSQRPRNPDAVNESTKAALQEQFAAINMNKLRPQFPSTILQRSSSVLGIFASANHPRNCLSPFSVQLALPRSSRQFSTFTAFGPYTLRKASQRTVLDHTQWRSITNNGHTSHTVLAHLEQTANNNPQSASAQNAFYSALLRANMPEILIERYDTGRYATNAACDAVYQRAVERAGVAHNVGIEANRNLSQDQLSAVGRAAVASARGGSHASLARGKNGGPLGTGEKSSPLHVVVDESRGGFFFKIARFFLIWVLIAYISLVLISFTVEASGIMKKVGGPQNAEVKPEQQKARFSDVKGCDEAKEELQEIVDFLKAPEKYNQLGGKLPKGVLMIGPPGTGKTLLARAVAGEAGVPFFYMSGSEFDEVYVGVGAKRVRELFTNAKSKAPAIVFIDELDAVGGKRNERDAAYHMQTLNQMLTELDGFDQTTGVVFIGATNFPQMLDKALTRPGRFDRQVVVPLPDVRGRVEILKYHMRNMQMAGDVDASVIARGTPGFSGADLENLVNQAAVHASKSNAKKVNMVDLDWAKDRIMMGAERKSAVIQEKDKIMTAYHEAGHALVGLFTKGATPLYKCTIMPRGQALGITHSVPEMDKVSQAKMELLAEIDVCMGGKMAEEIVYGERNVTSGCSSDLDKATRIAYAMVTEYGMSEKIGSIAFTDALYRHLSTETKSTIEAEVRRLLEDGESRARMLLTSKRKEMDMLAEALIKYETLSKEEIEKVIKGESLQDKLTSVPNVPIKLPELPMPPGIGKPGGLSGGEEGSDSELGASS